MPVNITLPLSPALQAVADARENVRKLGYKVEELKTSLKAAKGAWEEAVEELNARLDEMIENEKSPNLFTGIDDDSSHSSGGPSEPDPTPPAPAGSPTVVQTGVDPVVSFKGDDFQAVEAIGQSLRESATSLALPGGPSWRSLAVAEHLDAPAALFGTLGVFGVETLGELADRLQAGQTFNLKLVDLLDLRELIEQVSADDDAPIKFGGDTPAVTVIDDSEAGEVKPADLFTQEPEPAPEPEPTKPVKKGRKKKTVEEAAPDFSDL